MLQALVIVILFYQLQPIQCAPPDYCAIEKELCYLLNHVGCHKNVVKHINVPIEILNLKVMENIVNDFRRQYSKSNNISNMNMVWWDVELSYLAQQKYLKPEANCFKTYRHREVYSHQMEFEGSGIVTFLHKKTFDLFNATENKSTLFFMNPETTNIGCATYYKDNLNTANYNLTHSPPIELICLLDGTKITDYTLKYLPGNPCDACPQTRCYDGLCYVSKIPDSISYVTLLTISLYILSFIVGYLIIAVSLAIYYIVPHIKKYKPKTMSNK